MQTLLDDINLTLQDKDNPLLTEERILMLNIIRFFIMDEELIEKEKQQIIEAVLNFTNDKKEAEKYYKMTYGK